MGLAIQVLLLIVGAYMFRKKLSHAFMFSSMYLFLSVLVGSFMMLGMSLGGDESMNTIFPAVLFVEFCAVALYLAVLFRKQYKVTPRDDE